MRTFKQQLTDIVECVFDNEENFMKTLFPQYIQQYGDSNKSVEEFYMSGHQCRVVLSSDYGRHHLRSVDTQEVLDWYEEINNVNA